MKTNLFLLVLATFSHTVVARSPNIILLLADDQGWTGTSVRMDDRVLDSDSDLYKTPNLDKLASAGMKFSNAYAPAPNCSPTRMSIQTGKTAARLGASDIIDVVPGADGRAAFHEFYERYYKNKPMLLSLPIKDLPDNEMTIGEFLKLHNDQYVTAHFGKWHMGGGSPDRHGYDFHNGMTGNKEGSVGEPDPKRSSEITQQALNFIQQQTDSKRPFFIQVSYYAVHTPVLAKAKAKAHYYKNTGSNRRIASYVTVATLLKTDKKTSKIG